MCVQKKEIGVNDSVEKQRLFGFTTARNCENYEYDPENNQAEPSGGETPSKKEIEIFFEILEKSKKEGILPIEIHRCENCIHNKICFEKKKYQKRKMFEVLLAGSCFSYKKKELS